MSVTVVEASGGKAASRTSSARSDSGLFVGLPSVVRLPPSSVTIARIARNATAIHIATTRQGWLALAVASEVVESLTSFR